MHSNVEILIEADRPERHYWQEVWAYRELLFFLTWRDILVRYKQTAIGIAWSLFPPLVTMLTFTVVFGKIAKLPSFDVPYSLLVFSGIVPWLLFSGAVSDASNSLVNNSSMITKVYFPRILLPLSSTLVSLCDFCSSIVVLLAMMVWFGVFPSASTLFLPLFLVLIIAPAIGLGLLLSALNVKYRDFRYVVPFLLQCGLYVSPIGFSSTIVPEHWRMLFYLNPLATAIDGFRWSLLGAGQLPTTAAMLLSSLVALLLLGFGILFFRRTEKYFADII